MAIAYHRPFAEMETELLKKSWVVNHQRPTAETKVVEEYLSRYICRIGISSKRLHYDKGGKNVRIEYNDYANQEQGKAAPKKHRDLPLAGINMAAQGCSSTMHKMFIASKSSQRHLLG
ncbi:MAG: transposase [Lewinellaceae bacterium]|nr:transposase [Lewinellaceae bacterium]